MRRMPLPPRVRRQQRVQQLESEVHGGPSGTKYVTFLSMFSHTSDAEALGLGPWRSPSPQEVMAQNPRFVTDPRC